MKYPIGIQTFEKIRDGGFAYVDKTALIYDLVKGGNSYFLSRPRRFGKSLLVSTLESYFLGKRELFRGLAIEELERDWTVYPVLRLDLSNANYDSPDILKAKLRNDVSMWEEQLGFQKETGDAAIRFGNIIRRAYEKTGRKVVILIDEYDAPLVDLIGNRELLEANRNTLSGFYKNLKANDQYIQFALLTGVTKFGQLSVFSALNNLEDISLSKHYQSLCGITEAELHRDFDVSVAEMAEENGMTKEECYKRLKRKYDGYHFCRNGVGIYNPFSLLRALKSQEFGNYWFQTGTPTALIRALRDSHADITQMPGQIVEPEVLEAVNSYQDDLTALLYQSGYLTITGALEGGFLEIDFPNEEVRGGFVNQLVPLYSSLNRASTSSLAAELKISLIEGNVEPFIAAMRSMIASLSYEFFRSTEQAFQFVFYVTGVLIGGTDLRTSAERRTNRGRIDLLLETRNIVYIMEFKLDQSPEKALAQIRVKGYAEPWTADPRKKVLIGVNFSTSERNIPETDGWKMETL